MSYHHVDPADIEATPDRPSVQRSISGEFGLENLAVHQYEVGPGESIPLAYHSPEEPVEVFSVVEGELHVETPERDFVVGAGEVFAVTPESPQFAHVPEDGVETTALVVGAPNVDGEVHAYEAE